jgi:hypothetical protein
MTMATLIPYRQQDPQAVTIKKADSTQAIARARSELAAMEGISDLLARLPDAAARSRVLHWVDAIFRQDTPAPAPMPAPTPLHLARPAAFQQSTVDAADDCYLSVGDLDDWFEKDSVSPPDDRLPGPVSNQPVVSMIHGFVADFQKLARDWQED